MLDDLLPIGDRRGGKLLKALIALLGKVKPRRR